MKPKIIYAGTCGQVMALKKLLETYSALEINSTFYRFPSERQQKNWAKLLGPRQNFFLSVKAYQGFTHPTRSPTWKRSGLGAEDIKALKDQVGCLRLTKKTEDFWEEEKRLLKILKADFLLFQLPSFCQKEKQRFLSFFRALDRSSGLLVGLEIRWPDQALLEELYEKEGVLPVFDPFLEGDLREIFFPRLDFLYLRLHGRRDERGRLNYRYRYSDEELKTLLEWLEDSSAKTICVLFNNVYMKEDALRFIELLEGA